MISFFDRPWVLRRSTEARVGGCELIRVITIRHRAWLAERSPPGLSRWRVTFPDDAGMGAVAHRCAQAGSERSRSGWSPAAMSKQCRGVRADPVEGKQAGGVRGHEGDDELVEAGELLIEELGAAAPARARQA